MRGPMHPSGKYLYTVNIGAHNLQNMILLRMEHSLLQALLVLEQIYNMFRLILLEKYGFVNSGVSANYYTFSIDQTNGSTSLITGKPFSISGVSGQLSIIRIAQ